jgi:tetratricopeptide (TPR) repeat protein
LGRLALSRGDLAKGTEHFRKAFELDPLDPVSHFYLGVAAKRHGVHTEAIQFFSYCLGAEPSPECLVLRGEAYAALGQKDNALRDFQHAIERKADLALAYCQRGHLYQTIGQNEDARRDLERARQLSE